MKSISQLTEEAFEAHNNMPKQERVLDAFGLLKLKLKMKIGDRVKTPHGDGVITAIEEFRIIRFGVRLDNPSKSPTGFDINYYFKKELLKIK